VVDAMSYGFGDDEVLGLGRRHESKCVQVFEDGIDYVWGKLCFEGVIADWSTQDPGSVLGKLHVVRETPLHEVISGELKGGGKDATLVAPQHTLKVLAVEVSPAAVGFKHSVRLSNYVDVITEGDYQEVWEFFLQLGEGAVNGEGKEEASEGAPLFTADRVHDLTKAWAWVMEENAWSVTVHELDKAVDRRKLVEEWLPHLGPTPTVESIFGVKSAVDVLRIKFKVGRNCGRHKLATRRHTHAKLKWLGFQEEGFCFFGQGGEGDASQEAKKDMADDNGAKVTFIIFGNGNSSASIEEGDDGVRNITANDEVKHGSEVIRRGVIRKEPRPQGLVGGSRETPCRRRIRAADLPNDLGCGEDKRRGGIGRRGASLASGGWKSGMWGRAIEGEWRDGRGGRANLGVEGLESICVGLGSRSRWWCWCPQGVGCCTDWVVAAKLGLGIGSTMEGRVIRDGIGLGGTGIITELKLVLQEGVPVTR
jgi:hypothetical protein